MLIVDKAKVCVETTSSRILHSALPYQALESYNNPRLGTSDYLSESHRSEIYNHSAINDIRQTEETEHIRGVGCIDRYGFTTKNGYSYGALVALPEYPLTTIPDIGTSAWHTSLRGHNEHTIRNLMRAGTPVVYVGAEGSWHASSNPQRPITLADSAAAVLRFANIATCEYSLDSVSRNVIGESRGAMVGMGIVALAENFEQEIILADLTAPCLPRKMTVDDLREMSGQLRVEPKEIIKLGGRLALKRLIHYPATIDPNLNAQKHQLAIGFALFSGEAGELARHIPKESLMHVTTFNKDFASMESEWRQIFKNHPDVRVTPLLGSHLTLADPETLQFILARNECIREATDNKITPTQSNIFDRAHSFVENPTLVMQEAALAA